LENFTDCFEDLEDPRTGNAGRHDLTEILMIALCTVLCGGQYASDMALFAREKEAFLRQFLKLEHGLPSHDTPELAEGQPGVSFARSRAVSHVLPKVHAALCRNMSWRDRNRRQSFTALLRQSQP
jgi:hypothetical protein